MFNVEPGAAGNADALAGDLVRKRVAGVNGVGKAAELGDELAP